MNIQNIKLDGRLKRKLPVVIERIMVKKIILVDRSIKRCKFGMIFFPVGDVGKFAQVEIIRQ